METSCTIVIDV